MAHMERTVVLVDMDCFYCQVEENLNPKLKGKPVAVVQYNAWRGGGIIAVNYQARNRGVTRHMRGDEAKRKCPDIELVRVPTIRGKADLTKFRDAGKLVAKVLQTFTPLLERASVDEAYLDITDAVKKKLDGATKEITLSEIKNTHVVGCDTMEFLYKLYNSGLFVESNLKLAYGGVIAEEIRSAIYQQTGYTCSAGIAHNKILAKLACGLNKPNKQTILPHDSIQQLYQGLPVQKIRSLGGKFGHTLSEDLKITNMAELANFTEKQLTRFYDEKTARWLYNVARGIDLEPVTTRLISKSIGCCKKFPGKSALINTNSVTHWLNELALEIVERLEKDTEENNRKAKQMVVSFSQEINGNDVASSRTHNLSSYDANKITRDAFEIIKKNCLKPTGTFCLKFLGISAGKFEDCRNVNEITSFFKVNDSHKTVHGEEESNLTSLIKVGDKMPLNQKSQEEINDFSDENLTNFSDTTEQLDENSSDMVFFNEGSIENGSVSDSDSISNELCSGDSSKAAIEPQKESFFLRYFEDLKKHDRKSPVQRDFNTSRNLEEVEDECSDEEIFFEEREVFESKNSATCATNIKYELPGTSRDVFEFEEAVEVCDECGKKFLKSEMLSHMDHHFALKIVREESKLYKKENIHPSISKQDKKIASGKKSTKRKCAEIEKNGTLESFLNMGMEQHSSDVNAELCPQCNKKIDSANFSSHLDYHAAKKLHMEINSVKGSPTKNLTNNKQSGKRKNLKHAENGLKSVMTFFKPVN